MDYVISVSYQISLSIMLTFYFILIHCVRSTAIRLVTLYVMSVFKFNESKYVDERMQNAGETINEILLNSTLGS